MTLTPGTRLGPYEIGAPLGAGGMGEVYRARDVRLGRDVAVKALPAASGADPDRIARFEREAQILAGLSHPHIAALYGLEESGLPGSEQRAQFLIMELVAGGTLADRLKARPAGVRDAITIARQIADALSAAHDRGIIHRDLKPANIAFTADGHVKVLDFGLAKSYAPSADAPTVAPGGTQSGVVLGTAAYMSPEQARGQPLDKRTDIFSFGCVLYEMLTGRNPFSGENVSDVIVEILSRDPEWALLPAATPARVQWLLRRCLEKDPRRRLHDIADARIELDEALTNPSESGAIAVASATRPVTISAASNRERAAWAIALLSLLGLIGIIAVRGRQPMTSEAADAVYRTTIPLPQDLALTGPEPSSRFSLSPDGRMMVFVASAKGGPTMLWLRPLDSPLAQPIAGTEGATYPFWSPDSRHVGFTWRLNTDITSGAGKLKRVDVTGGQAVTLADVKFSTTGTWNDQDVILFTPAGNSPVQQVTASGGTASNTTALDTARGDVQHANPSFMPDGRHFVYTAVGSRAGGATAPTGVYLASLERGRQAKLLLEGASQAVYGSGYLLFLQGATLMAQPFDLERLELRGTARPLAERIQTAGTGGGVAGAYSVSRTGVLAFQTASLVRSEFAWFDRTGKQIATLGEQADRVDVVLSPDGSRVATSMVDPQMGTRDIWIFDVRRALSERFTSDPSDDFGPVWSPRGDHLIFSSARSGRIDLYQKSEATGVEQRIDDRGLNLGKFAASWSPDERSILFIAGGRTIGRSDLMLLPVGGGAAEPFVDSPAVETHGRFSPDGRWIAYASNVSGELQVYVKPYGRPGPPRRVSATGGRWPLWRRDSKELVFLAPDETIMSASVRVLSDEVEVGEIRPLFAVKPRPQVRLDAYPYDMTADGQRFLVNIFVEEPNTSSPLTLVVNWPTLLKK
jgi:serine/threonine protein kinase